MSPGLQRQFADTVHASVARAIVQLARDASVEINVQDLKELEASRAFLPPGQKIYVSYLPRQTWEETERACRVLHHAGFDAVPHVPVRLLADASALARLLAGLIDGAKVREILLIAGDCPQAQGPYSCVADVLRGGLLSEHGLRRVSFGGHPEGHTKVSLDEIRRAEREKAMIAAQLGLEATFVTQFFFESAPFLHWAAELRAAGVQSRLVAGLAGPARAVALVKYAIRCGVGPSIRALGTHPTSLMKLAGDHGPQKIMRTLAEALSTGVADFSGVHFFCFGGYLRTCEWLDRIASGRFMLDNAGGFDA